MIANIFHVDDGVSHWVFAETEEQVKEVMKKSYIDWYGENGPELEDMNEMKIEKWKPETLLKMHLDSGDEVILSVSDWISLYYMFVNLEHRQPMYWGCSEN